MKRLTLDIPDELHRRLRLIAADQDVSIKSVVVSCTERCLAEKYPDRTSEERASYDTKQAKD